MNTYRARNCKTGEIIEGSAQEIADRIDVTTTTVYGGANKTCRVGGTWLIEKVSGKTLEGHEIICKICRKTFVAKRSDAIYCSRECHKIGTTQNEREYRLRKKEENRKPEQPPEKVQTSKNPGVCKGCKYHISKGTYNAFDDSCDYVTLTGHSRLVVELEHGGFKTDSCVCYEKGRHRYREKQPIHL